MKSLIALSAIAEGILADGAPEVATGATFEAADGLADQLVASGDAKLYVEVPKKKTVKVRLLISCAHGKANDVVALPADEAQAAQNNGDADCDPAAVAYAESLV